MQENLKLIYLTILIQVTLKLCDLAPVPLSLFFGIGDLLQLGLSISGVDLGNFLGRGDFSWVLQNDLICERSARNFFSI